MQGKFKCFKLRQFFVLALALGLLVFMFVGCSNKQISSEKASGSGKAAIYTIADPTGDWGFPSPYAHYSRGPGYVRMSYIFDTLVWKDDQGYIPALAESWEYLKDENAYLFNLRKNVNWHDGQKFTAEDVVFTFN